MDEQMTAIVAEGNRRRLYVSPTGEHIQVAAAAEPTWQTSTGYLPDQAPTLVSGRGLWDYTMAPTFHRTSAHCVDHIQ